MLPFRSLRDGDACRVSLRLVPTYSRRPRSLAPARRASAASQVREWRRLRHRHGAAVATAMISNTGLWWQRHRHRHGAVAATTTTTLTISRCTNKISSMKVEA